MHFTLEVQQLPLKTCLGVKSKTKLYVGKIILFKALFNTFGCFDYKRLEFVVDTWVLYIGDPNTRLVWISNDPNLSGC